ncbi:N-6 DNA methylase [Streptosporangium sp. NPDC002721]|uniref:type I restriction-modification system subunit M n=1 Tax=Streptosporangium sp. NPDC002721 TaxID=3366188 RepID=UPI0036A63C11
MSRVTLVQLENLLLEAANGLGKLDISAKRNYVFALLLIKRCSDVFERSWQDQYDAELARSNDPGEATEAADDPEAYGTEVFVPPDSRWAKLVARSTKMGGHLNAALHGLERHNEDLDGVLRHVDFNQAPDGTQLKDSTLVELVRLFARLRLADEDLEFPDLIGLAYEKVLRAFAESVDSKGGDFYTARSVVRLMVRLAAPRPRDSVYDPCAGSCGMLVYAREHVADHHPGQAHTISLAGQELSTSHWAAGRMNLLLHGIRDADVKLGDTLTEPRHLDGGSPRRFNRILSNPEFSWKDYDPAAASSHDYRRFDHGTSPSADLMFVQHMVASLADDGVAVTVMPHGVLFRDRVEKEIRESLLRADAIEAVIGLGANILHGTGIPICLLILRAPGHKPAHSRGKVLFVNADREYRRGRKQNILGEEHAEKIVRIYEEWREVGGFSRAVPVDELLDDGANLNIRRWVDNTPEPEPQDVSAHLYGGIPRAEVEALTPVFAAYGLDPGAFFADPGDGYLDFLPEGHQATAARVDSLAGDREEVFRAAVDTWWREHAVLLKELPNGGASMAARASLISSFCKTVDSVPLLDEFTAAGIVAEWWADNLADVKVLAAQGSAHLAEAWGASAVAALPVRRVRGKSKPTTGAEWRAVRERPFVQRLLPWYAEQATAAEVAHATLDADVRIAEEEGVTAADLKKLKNDRDAAGKAVDAVAMLLRSLIITEIDGITPERAGQLVVDVFGQDVAARIEVCLEGARRELTAGFQRLADKYETSLEDLERERDEAAARLAAHLHALGYPRRKHQRTP